VAQNINKEVLRARIEELEFAKEIYNSVDVDEPDEIIWSKIFTLKQLEKENK
jgi:hypothetical protein